MLMIQTPDEWPWDLELVFVNINKLICKLVEGLRFFKAEYNSIFKWSKIGWNDQMVKNILVGSKKLKVE